MTDPAPAPRAPPPPPEPWAERVLRVLDHVHAHLDDPLDPGALADLAGASRHHFHRVFRGTVGESVMGYVRRRRLERAAFRLRHAGGDVASAAFAHGYDSHEGFTRVFRAHFGLPPSAYRDAAQRAARERLAAVPVTRCREPARRLLTYRVVGPYAAAGAAWGPLLAAARAVPDAWSPGPTFGLVYDDPEVTAPEHCRYDAAVALRADLPPQRWPAGVVERALPGGVYAAVRHVGPYADILDTYVALLGVWLPRQPAGSAVLTDEPVVERYLDAPGSVPDAALRTDVLVRLA